MPSCTERAVRELYGYKKMIARRQNIADRIDMIQDMMHSIKSSGADSSPVKTSGADGNKYDDYIDRKTKLEAEKKKLDSVIEVIERSVKSLSIEDQDIIDTFFFQGMRAVPAMNVVKDKYQIEEAQVWRKRKTAIKNYIYASGMIVK